MTSGLSAMSRDRTAARSSSTTRMYVDPLGGASDVGAWAAPRFHTSNPIQSPVIPARPNVTVRRRMVILYVSGDTSVPGTLTVIAGVFDDGAHVRGTDRSRFEQESESPLGHAKACGPRIPKRRLLRGLVLRNRRLVCWSRRLVRRSRRSSRCGRRRERSARNGDLIPLGVHAL